MSDRLTVDVELYTESFYDVLDGKTFNEVIQLMNDYNREYQDRDVYFSVESYGYDGGKTLELRERRLENDSEYNARIEKEKKQAAAMLAKQKEKEAKELAEYKRLKKKFEKK